MISSYIREFETFQEDMYIIYQLFENDINEESSVC